MPGELLMPRSTNPQEVADRVRPLGWCNQCITEAKQAIADGNHEPPPVHAAVTMVGRSQAFRIPQGELVAVITIPICWDHIVLAPKTSGLVAGQPGLPG